MWIKRKDCTIFFSLNEIVKIDIKKSFFKKCFIIYLLYKNGKKENICKTHDIEVAYYIFDIIMKSIEKNNAISLEIDYDVKLKHDDCLIENKKS